MRSTFELKGKFTPRLSLSLLVALFALGCGNLPNGFVGYRSREPVTDGGACGSGRGGSYACTCIDRPYVVAVEMTVGSSGGLANLQSNLVPASQTSPTASATPPAAGAASANDYWVATLLGSAGTTLATTVVYLPGGMVDGGHAWGYGSSWGNRGSGDTRGSESTSQLDFAVTLVPGAASLRIASWSTTEVLADLDLSGRLDTLCADQPCLSACLPAASGVDAGKAPAVDGGPIDSAPSHADGGASHEVDAGALDSARPSVDAGLLTGPLDASQVDAP